MPKFPTLLNTASKAEELEWLEAARAATPEGSYMRALLSAQFMAWVRGQVNFDCLPDIYEAYASADAQVMKLTDSLAKAEADCQKRTDERLLNLGKTIAERDEFIAGLRQEAGQLKSYNDELLSRLKGMEDALEAELVAHNAMNEDLTQAHEANAQLEARIQQLKASLYDANVALGNIK